MDRALPLQQIVSATMPSEPVSERDENHEDPNIVDWDGPNDPENPLNWPESRKTINLLLLSVLTIISYVPRSFQTYFSDD